MNNNNNNPIRMFIIKMRDNPTLQHIPMAVGGEGMLVIIDEFCFFQE